MRGNRIAVGLGLGVALAFMNPPVSSAINPGPCQQGCEHQYDEFGFYVRTICPEDNWFTNCVPNTDGECKGDLCYPTQPDDYLVVLDEQGQPAGLIAACDPEGRVLPLYGLLD